MTTFMKSTRRTAIGVAMLFPLLLLACPRTGTLPTPAGVDPVLVWDSVTADCTGAPATGVQYNVYAVSGPGPVPSAPSSASEPCGVVQLATGTPMNSVPLTVVTYHAIVPDGQWTFAVEAVLPSGARSGLSASVTVQVLNRAAPVAGVRVISP